MRSDTGLLNKNEDAANEQGSPGTMYEPCKDSSCTGTSTESFWRPADDNTDSQRVAVPQTESGREKDRSLEHLNQELHLLGQRHLMKTHTLIQYVHIQ